MELDRIDVASPEIARMRAGVMLATFERKFFSPNSCLPVPMKAVTSVQFERAETRGAAASTSSGFKIVSPNQNKLSCTSDRAMLSSSSLCSSQSPSASGSFSNGPLAENPPKEKEHDISEKGKLATTFEPEATVQGFTGTIGLADTTARHFTLTIAQGLESKKKELECEMAGKLRGFAQALAVAALDLRKKEKENLHLKDEVAKLQREAGVAFQLFCDRTENNQERMRRRRAQASELSHKLPPCKRLPVFQFGLPHVALFAVGFVLGAVVSASARA